MVAPGEIILHDVHKSFRAYHARSIKETFISVFKREPLTDRRAVLRGISLKIAPGERVGLVGKNGAGKSTLFRIMGGIMRPDRGVVEVGGCVSPLIEITSGFVADLTGRENLLLNAVLLGLTRKEAARRFDEIVAFANIGDFIDTPLRFYSSGMQARLGFGVAVHVDADIICVDETLAVGDVDFQARCLSKMHELSDLGVTILFVSHDPLLIKSFCRRVIEIDDGVIVSDQSNH